MIYLHSVVLRIETSKGAFNKFNDSMTTLHQTDESKVTQIDIFTEDRTKLKETSKKLMPH